MLDSIPDELKASWGQSCLKSASMRRALPYGTASATTVACASTDTPMLALPVSPVVDRSTDRSITVAASPHRAHPSGSAVSSTRMSAAKAMPTSNAYRRQSQSSSSYPWNR